MLHLHPISHLLTQAVLVIDGQIMGQPIMGRMDVTFVFTVEKHNQPQEETLFAFTSMGSQASATLQAWFKPLQARVRAAEPGGYTSHGEQACSLGVYANDGGEVLRS